MRLPGHHALEVNQQALSAGSHSFTGNRQAILRRATNLTAASAIQRRQLRPCGSPSAAPRLGPRPLRSPGPSGPRGLRLHGRQQPRRRHGLGADTARSRVRALRRRGRLQHQRRRTSCAWGAAGGCGHQRIQRGCADGVGRGRCGFCCSAGQRAGFSSDRGPARLSCACGRRCAWHGSRSSSPGARQHQAATRVRLSVRLSGADAHHCLLPGAPHGSGPAVGAAVRNRHASERGTAPGSSRRSPGGKRAGRCSSERMRLGPWVMLWAQRADGCLA